MRRQNKPFPQVMTYVVKLKQKFPRQLQHIIPERILYTSFSRKKSRALARIGCIPKRLSRFLQEYTYFMEVHEQSWNESNQGKKLYVVLHELNHIPQGGFINSNKQYKKLIRHDVQDFSSLIKKYGVNLQNVNILITNETPRQS